MLLIAAAFVLTIRHSVARILATTIRMIIRALEFERIYADFFLRIIRTYGVIVNVKVNTKAVYLIVTTAHSSLSKISMDYVPSTVYCPPRLKN